MLKYLKPFLTLGLSMIIPFIARRIRTGDDVRRAQLIALLAEGIVAELIARYPDRDFTLLVEEAVQILMTAIPSTPTKNEDAIRRAVTAAFMAKGVYPPMPSPLQ